MSGGHDFFDIISVDIFLADVSDGCTVFYIESVCTFVVLQK